MYEKVRLIRRKYSISNRGRSRYPHVMDPEDSQEYKFCSKCFKLHPLDAFHKNKNTWDGLSSHCKKCISKYQSNTQKPVKIVYECDAEKNKNCTKNNCYLDGGECQHTKKHKFMFDGEESILDLRKIPAVDRPKYADDVQINVPTAIEKIERDETFEDVVERQFNGRAIYLDV